MNKYQIEDFNKCEEMSSQGEDMECFGCSCNICIAQMPDEVESYKRQLLEKLELLKEDIPIACISTEEMFGANEMLKNVIKIIKE